MEWFKINPAHRPEVGDAMLASTDLQTGGTLYYVTEVASDGFYLQSHSTNGNAIPPGQQAIKFIPYSTMMQTNLHVWDRHRETNY